MAVNQQDGETSGDGHKKSLSNDGATWQHYKSYAI